MLHRAQRQAQGKTCRDAQGGDAVPEPAVGQSNADAVTELVEVHGGSLRYAPAHGRVAEVTNNNSNAAIA